MHLVLHPESFPQLPQQLLLLLVVEEAGGKHMMNMMVTMLTVMMMTVMLMVVMVMIVMTVMMMTRNPGKLKLKTRVTFPEGKEGKVRNNEHQ